MRHAPDLRQAENTRKSGASGSGSMRRTQPVRSHLSAHLRLGGQDARVEWEAWSSRATVRGCGGAHGFADQVCLDLVSCLRLVKPAEIAYAREAAKLADLALDRRTGSRPGVDEMRSGRDAVGHIRNGGDDPANEFIIGSGPDAPLCRYKTGRRKLDAGQLTLEFAGAIATTPCLMRTNPVGQVPRARSRCTRSRSTRWKPARRR
jgi:Xaa-Pro dipeptidase